MNRSTEHLTRVFRLQSMLREWDLDAVLLTSPTAVRYFSAFSGSNGMLLVRRRKIALYTDVRYEEQAAQESLHCEVHIARTETLLQTASGLGHFRTLEAIGIEDRHMTVAIHRNAKLLARPARLHPLGDRLEHLRMRKSPLEIHQIERAVAVTDAVFADVLALLQPGVREREIAAEISYRHRLRGADGDSFDPIVLFGARTSLIHGTPGDARLRKGDAILIDMGCIVDGYCSDMTRMCVVGVPSRRLRMLHTALCEAQDAARDVVAPGVTGRIVDGCARAVLVNHGVDDLFTHGLGHGVGLDIHELPRLSAAYEGRLELGHVVTIEPGIYEAGRIGARMEDMVVVEVGGARTLTRTPHDLVQV